MKIIMLMILLNKVNHDINYNIFDNTISNDIMFTRSTT